ncbi:MAG: hypothetical protein HY719_09055, partial [Planctomycetes bacterium]|nr:hypothetical protein [Planctomycetota bacterium]
MPTLIRRPVRFVRHLTAAAGVVVGALVLIAGCGGGGGSGLSPLASTGSVKGTVNPSSGGSSLSQQSKMAQRSKVAAGAGATVEVYTVKKDGTLDEKLATTTTDDQGAYTATGIPVGARNIVVVATVAGKVLRTVVPTVTGAAVT